MNNQSNNAGYFVLGVGFGVAVGMLFAPKAGRETREFLNRKAEEGVDYARRAAREMRDQVQGVIDRGEQAMSHQREALAEAVRVYRSQPPRHNGPADTDTIL